MARCLIVGCGCRGRQLAAELVDRGHVVRGTTRDPGRLAQIEASGAEAVLGDPDRLATLVSAFEHVSVAILLLGSAQGPAQVLAALHGPRLEALLTKLLDTTVRGIVYETGGTVDPELLRHGSAAVATACRSSRIPYAFLPAGAGDGSWLGAALGAVDEVLAG